MTLQMGTVDNGVKDDTDACPTTEDCDVDRTTDMDEMEASRVIAEVMQGTDVSPFEIIHSGVITKLLVYLTMTSKVASSTRELRLRRFLQVFLRCPVS